MKTAEEKAKRYAKKIIVLENRDSFSNEANLRTAEYWAYKAYLTGYNEAMRYLITTNIQPPFLSNWFDAENHFNAEVGMVVYDLAKGVYTTDGEKWEQIEEDHL